MKLLKFQTALAGGLVFALSSFAQVESSPAENAAGTALSEEIEPAPAARTETTSAMLDIAPAPDPLTSAAAVYATYHGDVTHVEENEFQSADDIQAALTSLGSQNAEQLARGWIAYSALVAAHSPEYRAAVRDIEGFYGRDFLVRGLQNDVRYARSLNGGTTAVRAALNAGEADASRLMNTAAMIKEQAYSLQAFGWAKGKLGDSGAIANRLRSKSLIGRSAPANLTTAFRASNIEPVLSVAGKRGAPSLWNNISNGAQKFRTISVSRPLTRTEPLTLAPGKENVADKIATLAAYRILGNDGADVAPLQSTMSDRETTGCMNMASLNLQQCIAATYQHFEVPFCLGEHALAEIGSCIEKVSN
jgi:hypothetical protein